MNKETFWQDEALNKIISLFKSFNEVKAIILGGSFRNDNIEKDRWSDIDLKVIIDDDSVEKFYHIMDWVDTIGTILGVQKFQDKFINTIRICFENCFRYDIVFINYSYLKELEIKTSNIIDKTDKLVFARIDGLESLITQTLHEDKFVEINSIQLDEKSNAFWFIGVSAVTKVMRGDYLIGTHLALEMVQECIVLQMMLRDRKKGTNVHRKGNSEHVGILEFVSEINLNQMPNSCVELIKKCGTIFDLYAGEYSYDYIPKHEMFNRWIDTMLRQM